jgi:hypothetical protein
VKGGQFRGPEVLTTPFESPLREFPLIMTKISGGGQIPRQVALVWREGRFDEVLLRVGVDKLVQ